MERDGPFQERFITAMLYSYFRLQLSISGYELSPCTDNNRTLTAWYNPDVWLLDG